MFNKFGKLNKKYYDIDDLVITEIAPVCKVGKTPSDYKYSLNTDIETSIIGYRGEKSVLDLISEQEYPIISKHYYSFVDKNKEKYFASGDYIKLRIYIEQGIDENISINLTGKKKDLISLEDIKKVYDYANGIDTNKEKQVIEADDIKNYHYYALLSSIANISAKINPNLKEKTKSVLIEEIQSLANEYTNFIIKNYEKIKDNPDVEMDKRKKIIEDMLSIEEKIVKENEKASLEKSFKKIKNSINKEDK